MRLRSARVTQSHAVRAGVARSQCVCCGACGSLFYRAWGWSVSESLRRDRQMPHPNPEGRHAPTAREPQTPHTPASLPPTFPRGRSTEDPGIHCSAQSV